MLSTGRGGAREDSLDWEGLSCPALTLRLVELFFFSSRSVIIEGGIEWTDTRTIRPSMRVPVPTGKKYPYSPGQLLDISY